MVSLSPDGPKCFPIHGLMLQLVLFPDLFPDPRTAFPAGGEGVSTNLYIGPDLAAPP